MAAKHKIPRNYIHGILEEMLDIDDDLMSKLSNSNTLDDFKEGDVVTCTIHGNNSLLRVIGFMNEKVTVTDIDMNSDIINISPKFLELAKVSKASVKVLYGDV